VGRDISRAGHARRYDAMTAPAGPPPEAQDGGATVFTLDQLKTEMKKLV